MIYCSLLWATLGGRGFAKAPSKPFIFTHITDNRNYVKKLRNSQNRPGQEAY